MKKQKWTFAHKRPGRPRKSDQTEHLVVRLAEDNGWGCRRIAGEMKKLGHKLCPGTVRNILIKNGMPPSPQRKGMSWRQFIKSHLDVAWTADFFTEEVLDHGRPGDLLHPFSHPSENAPCSYRRLHGQSRFRLGQAAGPQLFLGFGRNR
jgi:hypothetical protein